MSWSTLYERGGSGEAQNMNRPREPILAVMVCTLWACAWASSAAAQTGGRVADLNNQGLSGAMVTLTKSPQAHGPAAMTVFSDEHGSFVFPSTAPAGTLSVRGRRAARSDAGSQGILVRCASAGQLANPHPRIPGA